MIEHLKPIESLTAADLLAHPVWQYTNRDGACETFVRAVKRLPVKNLTGKVIGTQVRLANGRQVWALLGNLDVSNPKLTEHFLTLSIERDGDWFALARYHDFDYTDCGPDALARFLGLNIDEVFPICFDVRSFAVGDPAALVGCARKEPTERLSRAQIIAMAVP
jgi:hypothetical protein